MNTRDVDRLAKKLNSELTKPQLFRLMMSLGLDYQIDSGADNHGQIIIYTGMKRTDKGYEVMTDEDFKEEEEEDLSFTARICGQVLD